jgi:hypothetical protein
MTGEKDEGADPDQGSADGVYLEARASGHARVYQAARDMHIRYESEGLIAHRVEGADVVEECPYPGLAAFGPEEARWFFGRDALLAELTGMLSEHLPGRADCRGWLRRRQHPPVEHPALSGHGLWRRLPGRSHLQRGWPPAGLIQHHVRRAEPVGDHRPLPAAEGRESDRVCDRQRDGNGSGRVRPAKTSARGWMRLRGHSALEYD